MKDHVKKCVRGLQSKQNVEDNLCEYAKLSNQYHGSYSAIKLSMEYYVFYEILSEKINPYCDMINDMANVLHPLIRKALLLVGGAAGQKHDAIDQEELKSQILELRRQVTDQVQVLSAYVDCFVNYEYIFNRLQYRFEDQEAVLEDIPFTEMVIQYIFGTKDNVVINDRIRQVLGQLPMRMSRARYYDLIRNSISVYEGSEKGALDGFLYMFRTNAMLYQSEGMKQYFTEFAPLLEELSQIDYEKIQQAEYAIYAEKLQVNTSKLTELTDLYMLLAQLINSTYSMVLTGSTLKKNDELAPAFQVIDGVNDLFLPQNSTVWDQLGGKTDSQEKNLDMLTENFVTLEGLQESCQERNNMADAVLGEVMETWKKEIEELGLEKEFQVLVWQENLCSNSSFADLNEGLEEQSQKVTSQMAEQETERLITELKELFAANHRLLRRAVMANTLEKIPVFFNTPQEVADYISLSLQQCEDRAEKYASKQMIQEMMED